MFFSNNVSVEASMVPLSATKKICFSRDSSRLFASMVNGFNLYVKLHGTHFKTFVNMDTLEMVIAGFIVTIWFNNSNELGAKFNEMKNIPILWYIFSVCVLGFALITMVSQTSSEFLYFNF